MSTYRDKLNAEKQLLESLSNYEIQLGVVQLDTKRKETVSIGLTNAELMFIHENGSPMRNIPSRPVLDITIRWALAETFLTYILL